MSSQPVALVALAGPGYNRDRLAMISMICQICTRTIDNDRKSKFPRGTRARAQIIGRLMPTLFKDEF